MTSDGKTIDKIAEQLVKFEEHYNSDKCSADDDVDWTFKRIAQWKAWDQDKYVQAHRFGYEEIESGQWYPSRPRTAIEEMVRWRLWDRTGGGLMAELGSHQLDAASIFISALAQKPGKHVHPLSVHAIGGRHTAPKDRDAADHVYCTFDFPGQGYDYNFDVGYEDKVNSYPPQTGIPAYNEDDHSNKRVVVTYSSINGNGYGGYGEVVMGTKATMVLDREKEVMGYREEIEHWAWCIQQSDLGNQPRCNGPVALADATIALTAKLAIDNSQKKGGHGFIQFQPGWFEVDSDDVPEANGNAEANQQAWTKAKKNCGLA